MRALSTSTCCVLGLAALLAACGGGGGGGNSNEPEGRLTLSADNYVRAGQEALSAGMQFEETSEFIVGAQVSRRDDSAFVELALRALRRHLGTAVTAPPLAVGAVVSTTFGCDNAGGSYTLSANDANGNDLFDAGDTLTYTFSQCVLDGDSANGSLSIGIRTLSGSLGSNVYSATLGMTMNGLSLSGSSGEYTGDGQFDISIAGTAAHTGSASISAPSFRSSGRFGGSSSTRTLSNYSVAESHVPENGGERSTLRFEGSLASTGLENKRITLSTRTPFVVAGGAVYPSSGQAVVSGAGGGTVRITALDAVTVRFELDANGDGSYETSSTRTWASLL